MKIPEPKGNNVWPSWSRGWRRGLAAAALLMLAACGGGGGAATDPASSSAATVSTNANAIVLDQAQAGLISVQQNATGDTVVTIPANTSLGGAVDVGKTFLVLPGQSSQFPLGFAGEISDVSLSATGQTTVTLVPTRLADVVDKSQVNQPAVSLSSDNFLGVIAAPSVLKAIQPSAGAPTLGQLQTGLVAMNGALVMRSANPNQFERAMAGVSFLGTGGSIDVGEIALNFDLKLAEIVNDPSRLKSYGAGAEGKVTVAINFKNLKLVENHEYDKTLGVTTGLKSLDLRVEGDLVSEIKFSGGVESTLGYFSQAWKEVEEESIKILGVSAKLTGLDSKDKIGNFPIAGLVFSVPCPSTCPVTFGSTQTPLRAAKVGGIILWIYITADGTLKVDGSVGARANNRFSVGMQKPEEGELKNASSFSRIPAKMGNVLEAPFLDGAVDATVRMGPSFDVDFFTWGVRLGNIAVDSVGQVGFKGTGVFTYGLPNFGQRWAWSGTGCTSGYRGAGIIVSARAGVGAKVETGWGQVSGSVDLTYGGQWPTEEEIIQPGWHGFPLGNYGTWYTDIAINDCWPQPFISGVDISVSGTTATIKVNGSNLPDDMALTITPTGVCSGVTASAIAATSITYTCTVTTASQSFTYGLTSAKASNLDTSAVAGSWGAAPSQTATITQVMDDLAPTTGAVANGGSTDDTTPTLSGTLSANLANTQSLLVYDGTVLLGGATVTGQSWFYTTGPQAVGSHSYKTVVSSVDGIEGTPSNAWSIVITTTTLAPSVSSITPNTATVNVPVSLSVTGQNLPLTAVMSIADADCQTPTNSSTTGFTVVCTPGSVVGSKVVTISAAFGGPVIDATRSVTVSAVAPPPSTLTPAVSGVNPTAMVANGIAQTLTIVGSGFTSGNIVQFRWGVGTGAGVWNNSANPISSLTASQIRVPMNPGTVTDTIYVRVCVSSSQTSTIDCSSGTAAASVAPAVVAPPAAPTFTSVAADPAAVTVGVKTTFDVLGSSLQPGYVFALSGCSPTEVSSSSTTKRQFICTPTVSGTNLQGSISSATGAILYSFVQTVGSPATASLPTQGERLSAGQFHSCAITSTGGVKCWGANNNSTLGAGQLGDGTGINRLAPVDVVGLGSGVAAVSAGGYHTCALTNAGGVKCWGQNFGALGDGTSQSRLTPVDVVGLDNGVAAVSASLYGMTCALTSAGGVKCWGSAGGYGVGDGTTEDRLVPVDVVGLSSGAVAISTGTVHACAITLAGGIKCWGANYGALGDGTTVDRLAPVDVIGLTDSVTALAAGRGHTCALTTAGGVKCWGRNTTGQLGDGTTITRQTAIDVVGLAQGVIAISAGEEHTCAVTAAGGVKCWGSGLSGQVGDGSLNVSRLTPVDVTGLSSGFSSIAAGGQHTCARSGTGGIKCWGFDGLGGLGDGTGAGFIPTPVNVLGF